MDLTNVTKRIDRFRTRIRTLYLASGVARVLFVVGILLLLSYLLDYFLDLPVGVRIGSFVVAIAATLVAAVRTIFYPLSVRFGDDDLALAAESRMPELRDRLISALQFRQQLNDPENAESPEMMRAVIEEAGRLEQAVSLRRLLDGKRVRRHAYAAALAFGVLLFMAVVAPGLTGTWAKRNLLLMDLDWPRATTLVVEGFPENGKRVVTRGESLRIDVRAVGKIPGDVDIRIARLDEDGPVKEESRRMYQVEEEPDLFRFEFRQIPGSFTFFVVGGDDTDEKPVYTVLALVPPTIEWIQAACKFPEHTRMAEETFREADLDLPAGTEVSLSIRVNMPLASSQVVVDDASAVEMTLSDGDRIATYDFTVVRSFDYEIRLEGAKGQLNLPGSARFRIRSVQDRKPAARILHPAARPWHTTKSLVPFKVLANDNYGVSRVSLFVKKSAEEEFTERRFTAAETFSVDGEKEIVCYAAIPIAELAADQENPVRVGDEITYYAEAEDNNGNRDLTDRYRIEVVSEEDLERRLSQRQTDLRDDSIKTRQKQDQAHREVAGLIEFLAEGNEFVTRDREQLRDIQIRQGIVTRDMDQFFSTVTRVFNSYVYNRLAKPSATERILVIFDDFLKSDLTELSTVFKRELYEKVIAEYRAERIYDNQILAVLIEILEITVKITGQTSPEAHRLLVGLARGEAEKGLAEDLERVHALQTDILADFRLLDRKMQRWESYAELIEFLRDVKAIQGGVRSGAEKIIEEGRDENPK